MAALEYLQNNPSPQTCCYLADLYEWGSFELGIAEDAQKAREWLLKAAEGGDLRAQYQLGTTKIETESDNDITEGLKWLWTAAQGLYPPALACWKAIFNSFNEPNLLSYLNVERGQINEMAENCGLLSRLMECSPNDQQAYLETVMAMPHYSDSVLAALREWEKKQESPHAIETLVQSLYGLACLDRDAPMKSPTATPDNKPVVTPK